MSFASALYVLSVSAAAAAQASAQEKAAAEALFDDGRAMLESGNVATACKRFEQSQAIDAGVGTLLYLGDCYERLGRLASAWAIFREASSAAKAAGQSDRSRIADERAGKLEPQLSRIALRVPDDARSPGFELLLDGRPISSALFGVSFPIDSGTHQLEARAPGRVSWLSAVDVRSKAERRTVQVPLLMARAAPGSAMASGSAEPGSDDRVEQVDRTLTLVLGGVGVASVATGVFFGLRASSKDSDADADCPGDRCITQAGAQLNEDARSSALVANVAYGVGLASLAAATFFYFTARSSDRAPSALPRVALAPLVGRVRGVSLSARF